MSDVGEAEGSSVRVEAISEYEDDEEALENIVGIKDAEFDNIFTNRATDLDTDGESGISLTFTHDDKENVLYISTDDSSNINIDLYLDSEDIAQSGEVLKKIHNYVADLKVKKLTIFKLYDIPFRSLDLPIDEETNLEVAGIKVRKRGGDYIIQENDEGNVSVLFSKDINVEIKDDDEFNIATPEVDQVDDFVTGDLKI